MPTPIAPPIRLSHDTHRDLHLLARAHSTPQSLALRARIILRAAEPDTPSNLQIGRDLGCSNRTVGKWRKRYHHDGLVSLQDARRSGRPRRVPSKARVIIVSAASQLPQDEDRTVTRWSLDELVDRVMEALPKSSISRSTIWRVLEEIDLKPHKSAYWLNSHDEDFETKASNVCQLYRQAQDFFQQGRLVISCDEKTGMQVLERKAPTKPARPGKRERREHEYIRHGTRVLIASLAVATGQLAWTLGNTRTSLDFIAHLKKAYRRLPRMTRYDWIMDNLNTHWSLAVCHLFAKWCKLPFDPKALQTGAQRRAFLTDPTHRHVIHFTPKHGSWLNQVELFFGVLQRRFLAQSSFRGKAKFDAGLQRFLQDYNARHAHPYRWTYTGEPLVRDTPFSRTRRQECLGRAVFSPRPKRFERLFYPPRPYRRQAA